MLILADPTRAPAATEAQRELPPSRWDRRVERWEKATDLPAFREFATEIQRLAAPTSSDVVVDLGAGTGLLALTLAPQVGHVVAVDSSRAMLERLALNARRNRAGNVLTVLADLRSLPLPDESVSLAVSSYAFHHLDDAGKALALAEVRRVLLPGGRLVIGDMMFSLSLAKRDRQLVLHKTVLIARRGPAGIWRLCKNLGRLLVGSWEHPAAAETWRKMLADRHFAEIDVRVLEHEGGIATARRPE